MFERNAGPTHLHTSALLLEQDVLGRISNPGLPSNTPVYTTRLAPKLQFIIMPFMNNFFLLSTRSTTNSGFVKVFRLQNRSYSEELTTGLFSQLNQVHIISYYLRSTSILPCESKNKKFLNAINTLRIREYLTERRLMWLVQSSTSL